MKRCLVLGLVLAVALICSPAYAFLDDNSTNQAQGQGQAQGQAQGQEQGQGQGQSQGQVSKAKAVSDSDSLAVQGQLGIVGQGTEVENKVVIEGNNTEVLSTSWPTTQSTAGKEEKSIYSVFGGVGSNETEEHLKIEHQLKVLDTLLEKNLIDEEEYDKEVKSLYKQLKEANKAPKLLGFIPFGGRGCSLLNVCGLLAW